MTDMSYPRPGAMRLACDECHRLKVKCTRGQPCERCSLRSRPCQYSIIVRKPPTTSAKRKAMEVAEAQAGLTGPSLHQLLTAHHHAGLNGPYGMDPSATKRRAVPHLLEKMDRITERLLFVANRTPGDYAAPDTLHPFTTTPAGTPYPMAHYPMAFTAPPNSAVPTSAMLAALGDYSTANVSASFPFAVAPAVYDQSAPFPFAVAPTTHDRSASLSSESEASTSGQPPVFGHPLPATYFRFQPPVAESVPVEAPPTLDASAFAEHLPSEDSLAAILSTTDLTYKQLRALIQGSLPGLGAPFDRLFLYRFLTRLKLGIVTDFLLFSVLGIGAHFVSLDPPSPDDKPQTYRELSHHFFQRSEALLVPALEHSSLDHIMAILNLAQLAYLGEDPDKALFLLSLAFNMGLSMGLHRSEKVIYREPVNQEAGSPELLKRNLLASPDRLLNEFHARFWWELYSHEVIASVSLDKNPALPASDTSCAFPSDDATFHSVLLNYFQRPSGPFYTDPAFPTMFPLTVHNFGNSLPFIQLVIFSSIAQSHIYKRHLAPDTFEESGVRLYAIFIEWWNDVAPDTFALDALPPEPDLFRTDRRAAFKLAQTVTIHAFYHTTILCLFTLPKNCKYRMSDPILQHCQSARWEAAQGVATLLDYYQIVPPEGYHYMVPVAFIQAAYCYLDLLPGVNRTSHPLSPTMSYKYPFRGAVAEDGTPAAFEASSLDNSYPDLSTLSMSMDKDKAIPDDSEASSTAEAARQAPLPMMLPTAKSIPGPSAATTDTPAGASHTATTAEPASRTFVTEETCRLSLAIAGLIDEILQSPDAESSVGVAASQLPDHPLVEVVQTVGRFVESLRYFLPVYSKIALQIKDINRRLRRVLKVYRPT
ncbi:hypothetical protein IWQ60_001214 [Tieghemiomyces parasiticus]|uniref:Zn(2)-C6 fungal-type domain-containing protein n=1 Tax=Tieghemiomyces parasiticus TaxID=78921 RepID=A0A9W8DYI6_9FUNG|nr:hypothetical protein IWQ60_001214 [Tieghemiomyces parasiticus]